MAARLPAWNASAWRRQCRAGRRRRLPEARRRRRWRHVGGRLEPRDLIAPCVHALRECDVVLLLDTNLRRGRAAGPGAGARQAAYAGADRGTTAAADRRA